MASSKSFVSSPRWSLHYYFYGHPTSKPSAFAKSPSHNQILTSVHYQNQTHTQTPAVFLPLPNKYDVLIDKVRFSRSISEARQFHLHAIKNGFVCDLFMCNTLINAYLRSGELAPANKVFDEMPEKNSVTWACLISGYTQNEMPSHAFAAFRGMVAAGFVPNHYAVGSALRACQRMGNEGLKHGVQIHGLVSKTSYAFDMVVCNVLISMYGNCLLGSAGSEYAWRVFDGIVNKNSVSWNSIISVYTQRGEIDFTFGLFSDMQKEGSGFSCNPTEYTFPSLVTAAGESFNVARGSSLLVQLLAKIEKSGFVEDLYVGSALVSGLAKIGALDTAMRIFELMGSRNAVSVNGLIVGLVKLGRGEEALEVFLETRDLVRLNVDSYVLLLGAFGEFSCLEEGKRKGKEVHGYLMRAFLT